MIYLEEVASRIFELTSEPGERPTLEDILLYRIYAVLCLAKGTDTTLEDVHDAWVAWKLDFTGEHRSFIPFSLLSLDVQELDRPYMEAIHTVAQERARRGDL